jgi:hypothetical protein
MPPISSQNRSSQQRPRLSSRPTRERLVEQARIIQRRLGARRPGGASADAERAAV